MSKHGLSNLQLDNLPVGLRSTLIKRLDSKSLPDENGQKIIDQEQLIL